MGEGSFGLFSLTEHLGFMIQQVPIVAALGCLLIPYVLLLRQLNSNTTKARISGERYGRIIRFALLVVGLTALVMGYNIRGAMLLSMGLALVAVALLLTINRDPAFVRSSTMAAWVLCLCLVIAFAVGVDITRGQLGTKPDATIVDDQGTIDAIVLRSGERGLLFFDTSSNRFDFRRWDGIKKINWRRVGMLDRMKEISRSTSSPFLLPRM